MRRPDRWVMSASLVALATAGLSTACGGAQSTLVPAGRDASHIAAITAWLTAGAIALWAMVLGLAWWASRVQSGGSERAANRLIIGGGVVLPVIVLSLLLFTGLRGLSQVLTPAADDRLSIDVTGQQWWWRVRYQQPGLPAVELANEIHLPVSRRVNTRLASADVVHSFWIPSLAGKMDMIPGRVNRLALEAERTGTFRGTCAEFCGLAHARMGLVVVVSEPDRFDAWLRQQAQPARPPATEEGRAGARAFDERGCGTCHTIRGTAAAGVVGPDLTHVASRASIAAATLPATYDSLRRWIADTHAVKPGARMPPFGALPPGVLDVLARYLSELQ